jgi:hypothetical protein
MKGSPLRKAEAPLLELTPVQTAVVERLVARGFTLVAFPLYASAIGVRRNSFAALLVPAAEGGLRMLAEPCYLIDGNLAVQVQRAGGPCFVWKGKTVEATAELLAQLRQFTDELHELLSASA